MEHALKAVWGCATMIGTRRITGAVSRISAYHDTAFFFDGVDGYVALSIDDGISRGGPATSLAADVLALLQRHDARCTFFVCSQYISGVPNQAADIVAAGHELANHLEEDVFGYSELPAARFETALQSATEAIEAVPGAARVRWFRAPQGVFTHAMKRVTDAKGLRHAIGDAYCDDWAVTDAKWVARTLLRQGASDGVRSSDLCIAPAAMPHVCPPRARRIETIVRSAQWVDCHPSHARTGLPRALARSARAAPGRPVSARAQVPDTD